MQAQKYDQDTDNSNYTFLYNMTKAEIIDEIVASTGIAKKDVSATGKKNQAIDFGDDKPVRSIGEINN